MDYFRAILQKDERSPRALALTQEVIALNAANYTAWHFRRLVLDELKADLHAELEFVSELGLNSPKNYQIWYHRRAIVERLQDFSAELEYTSTQLDEDSKNYHAWAHRQWVVEVNGWWDQELHFIDSMLKKDLRNNSSWNQRYFSITHNKNIPISDEIREREIKYAFEWIRKAPNNQSPWTYIKG
jgi:protein farnesyltransferase/geranylgeranyltransferase type-1 subunit alpha